MSHDLVLADDNIMIPLLIQYPGCPKGRKIEIIVGSIDIYPTILDILNIDITPGVHGRSLLPLINGSAEYSKMMKARFHRCDSRLSFQTGRGTAIRNGSYKYIYYHDNLRAKREEFFNIENDKLEENDLVNSEDETVKRTLEIFRKAFRDSENDAMNFQLNYLFRKFSGKYHEDIKNAKNILITDSCRPLFIDMLTRMIKKINHNTEISVLLVEHHLDDFEEDITPIYSGVDSWTKLGRKKVRDILKDTKVDILFAPYNTSEQRDNASFIVVVKQIRAGKKAYLDYNMEGFKKTIGYYWKIFRATWPFIKHEPSFLLSCCVRFLKYIFFRKQSDWAKAFKS